MNQLGKPRPSGNFQSLRMINFDLVRRKSIVEYLVTIPNSACANLNSWVSLPQEAPPESFTISINGNSNLLVAQAENHESSLRLFQNLLCKPSRKSLCPPFKTHTEFKHVLPPPSREPPSSFPWNTAVASSQLYQVLAPPS